MTLLMNLQNPALFLHPTSLPLHSSCSLIFIKGSFFPKVCLLTKCKPHLETSLSYREMTSNAATVRPMNTNIWITHLYWVYNVWHLGRTCLCKSCVSNGTLKGWDKPVNVKPARIFHYGIFFINQTKTLRTHGVIARSVNTSRLYLTSGRDFPESHNSSECLPSKSNLCALSSISPTVLSSVTGRTLHRPIWM